MFVLYMAVVHNLFRIYSLLFKKRGRVILVCWLTLSVNSAKEVKNRWGGMDVVRLRVEDTTYRYIVDAK
jgi:hypothetical protein